MLTAVGEEPCLAGDLGVRVEPQTARRLDHGPRIRRVGRVGPVHPAIPLDRQVRAVVAVGEPDLFVEAMEEVGGGRHGTIQPRLGRATHLLCARSTAWWSHGRHDDPCHDRGHADDPQPGRRLLRALAITVVVIGHWLMAAVVIRDGEVVLNALLNIADWTHR